MGGIGVFNRVNRKLKQQVNRFWHTKTNTSEETNPEEKTSPVLLEDEPYTKQIRRKRWRGRSFALSSQVKAYLRTSINRLAVPVKAIYATRHHPRFWLLLGMGLGASSSAVALGWGVYQLESSVTESVEEVLTYAREGTITIESADGVVLQEIGDVTHEKLKIWQIPDPVIQTFIASEDRRFETHGGVDFQGILRASWVNLRAGEVVEGGSTITQQLARIVFLSQERSFARKFKEMRLAQKIEQDFDKAQILEKYLNLVYLGSGAYGVADAAWVYFGKTADQLTIAEAATLAGIIPAPSQYSPLQNPKLAKERRDLVLERLKAQGIITEAEAEKAIASPLTLNPKQLKRLQRRAPYFTEYVQQQLKQYIPEKNLKQGGIVVETTLNAQWQKQAEAAIEKAVTEYGNWQGFKQAALVAIDPRNGQIKAMVGGNDFENNQYNRVTQAQRQPGSTFKPFVYATAIAAGFSPNQGFLDAEYVVDGYKPENYGDQYSGNYVSMRNALAASLNVVAVKILVDVGWNPIIKVAKNMGIESPLKPTYSLALGAWEVNLLELTSAYGTFANEGIHQNPYGISRILDRHGNVLYQTQFSPQTALDPETTAIMTWMLQGVVTGGTGQGAQLSRPVAGKTGTSDKARDLWFVGYIPQLVTGVWLGNDNNQPTGGASTTAALVWHQFMEEAVKQMAFDPFPDVPRKLDGRKGTIKAEPIKPKRSYYKRPEPTQSTESTQATSQTTYRRSSRRSSRRRSEPQTTTSQPRRRSRPATASRPSQPAAPSASQPATSAPIAAPPPVSAVNAAPPAPPAARKTE